MQLLGLQGFSQHQVLRASVARAAGNIVLNIVLINRLQYYCLANPPLRSLAGHSLQGQKELATTEWTLSA